MKGKKMKGSGDRLDPRRPVSVWRSQDLVDGRPAQALTMILRTRGCRWNRCTMCGYASEGAPTSADDLIAQFERGMERCSPEVSVVKIYTSGSFLDPEEMPAKARARSCAACRPPGSRS